MKKGAVSKCIDSNDAQPNLRKIREGKTGSSMIDSGHSEELCMSKLGNSLNLNCTFSNVKWLSV